MTTKSQYSGPAALATARHALLPSVLAAACVLAGSGAAAAQDVAEGRLWAAQTGVNQVSLAWDLVPAAAEYRIYLGDPSTGAPMSRLSGTSRGRIIIGLQRVANGITLVAVDASGRVLRQAEFNRVIPAASFPPATPPASVTAQATSGNEIVVIWDPVPGATAYAIGRAVHRSGFSMLCALCSTEGRYVDRGATAGLPHTYTVAAIFPTGEVSRRATSSPATPKATQLAITSVVTPSSMPASALPTTSVMTPSSVPRSALPPATSVAMPPGQSAGTMPTMPSVVTPPNLPAGTFPTTTTAAMASGASMDAVPTSPTPGTGAMVSVTGTPSPVGNLRSVLDSVLAGLKSTGTTAIRNLEPIALAKAQGSLRSVIDSLLPGRLSGETPPIVPNPQMGSMQVPTNVPLYGGVPAPPSATAAPSPSAPTLAGGPIASCRLDYLRADQASAGFGIPMGSLGAESVSLSTGQNKLFITDRIYEKQRNDGTNFFGSHLRIAINAMSSRMRLHLRSSTLTGLEVLSRTGEDTFWIRLDPSTTRQLQADLMEVVCEN